MPKAITVLRLRTRGNNLATASRLALDGTKKNCYTAVFDGKHQTVLEFFAVGNSPTAVLLRAVKGGVSLPLTKISAFFKVHWSLFLWLCFFIGHLTLSF